jgi:hypothetical protein
MNRAGPCWSAALTILAACDYSIDQLDAGEFLPA